MVTLPNEILQHIVDQVDRPRDLFVLLTVNKVFFELAARALYCDPLRFAVQEHSRYFNRHHLGRLLRFLTILSPANDVETQVLRDAMGITPSEIQEARCHRPTIDYLQLVQRFRWGGLRGILSLHADMGWKLPKSLVRKTDRKRVEDSGAVQQARLLSTIHFLQWAVVGHQLHRLQELDLEVGDMDRYTALAPSLVCLTKIRVRCVSRQKELAERITAFVLAMQQHHGPNQLYECELAANPLLFVRSRSDKAVHPSDAVKLYNLLPKPRMPLVLPNAAHGPPVILDRPFDRDLARIEQLSVATWDIVLDHLLKYDSEITPIRSQLLQRFRGLQELHLQLHSEEDDDILTWAALEASERLSNISNSACREKKNMAAHSRPVPISRLVLEVPDDCSGDSILPKVVEDALFGFSRSLKHLTIGFSGRPHVSPTWMISSRTPLPQLSSIHLKGRIENPIEINLMDNAPNFSDFTISYWTPPLSYPEPTHALLSQTDFPTVRVRSRSLRILRVMDHAILYFSPDSLQDLPSLNELYILHSHKRADDNMMLARWDVPLPLPWTWDWYLPNLKTLCLRINLHMIRFSFRFLASCPSLTSVNIDFISFTPFSLRTALLVENEMNSTGGDDRYGDWVSTSVISLRLRGSLDIPPLPPLPRHNTDTNEDASKQVICTTNDIEYFRHPLVHLLIKVFPSLETFEYFPSGKNNMELIHEVVQMTLPTLHQHSNHFPNKLQRVRLPIPAGSSWNEEQKRKFRAQYGFVNTYYTEFRRPRTDPDELRGPLYVIKYI